MIDHVLRYTIPAAYALLPTRMNSSSATAMLLAIGLQESQFIARRQGAGGPARGFWQFELAGLSGVIKHEASASVLVAALRALRYDGPVTARICSPRVEHNDTLACIFARLLLWTIPDPLPQRDELGFAWTQYLQAWRPGKPHEETWPANYAAAWDCVDRMTRV